MLLALLIISAMRRTPPFVCRCTSPVLLRYQFSGSLDLRDARDAHVVFEAVRLGILPLITRRLTANEREQLVSGNVFVWEEAEHKQGESCTTRKGLSLIHPRFTLRVIE